MTDLKPCPFCGCEMSIAIMDYNLVKIKHYSIVHPNNGCILENYESCETSARGELVDKWNRRADDDTELLALFNGWLDSERYNCDNSEHD